MIKNAEKGISNIASETLRYLLLMALVMLIFIASFAALPYFIEQGLLWKMVIKRIKYENPSFSSAEIKIERDGRKETVYIHIFERDESAGSYKKEFEIERKI